MPQTYTFQGRQVTMPVQVRDASSGAATFVVSAAAARRLIPTDAFEVCEIWPGRALCSIAAIEYRDNDLDEYNEVSIAFFVRERGAARGIPYLGTALDFVRGRVATYIHRLPVNAEFTCEAGRGIWGFPKTVEEIEIVKTERCCTCRLAVGGVHALTLALPRGGTRRLSDTTMVTLSLIDGVPHRTVFTSGGEGVGFRLGGADLVLGNHPIADELRRLGLPKRALTTMWVERMRGRFEPPERLRSAAP